jgi:DNA (cytosine-5)-methyltransferase 1
MLRVIHEFKPTWVIAENVRGLLTIEQGVVFEQVCLDLEREGYEVQPLVIPAVAVNAPHRRDRVWIVGHAKSSRSQEVGEICKGQSANSARSDSDAPDTGSKGLQGRERPGTLCTREAVAHGAVAERCGNTSWEENWLEVATELCGVDDGLPAGVDTFTLTKSRHRVERLKSLGNAIVPQVAVEIMRAIKHAELVDSI